MTVIIGINWFTEMLILADTRISWENQSRPPEDKLLKLYKYRTANGKTIVFGFSGNIEGIKKVMQELMEKKFPSIKERLFIEKIKDDLLIWLREITPKLPLNERKLSFMLCGFEPYRPPFFGKNPEKILVKHLMNQETYFYIYNRDKNGNMGIQRSRSIAITGSGKNMSREIVNEIGKAIRFGFDQPNLHWARAMLVTQRIAEAFKKSKYDTSVGGPFQTIRITPEEVTEFYTWPPDLQYYDVEIIQEPNITRIYNPRQNKTYNLYPIWSLPPL